MPPPPVLGVPSGRGVRPTPAACPAALNAWLYHAIRAMRQGPRRPPLVVVEAALAHTVRNPTEAAYARSDLFERRRRLMDDWAAYLDERLASLISATADVCVGEQTGRGSSKEIPALSSTATRPERSCQRVRRNASTGSHPVGQGRQRAHIDKLVVVQIQPVLQQPGRYASRWGRTPPAGRQVLWAAASGGGGRPGAGSRAASPAADRPDRRSAGPPGRWAGRGSRPPRAATGRGDTPAIRSSPGRRHCSGPAPSRCSRRRQQRGAPQLTATRRSPVGPRPHPPTGRPEPGGLQIEA